VASVPALGQPPLQLLKLIIVDRKRQDVLLITAFTYRNRLRIPSVSELSW